MDPEEQAFKGQQRMLQARREGIKRDKCMWYTYPGMGFKVPREAREGHYVDKKCPFTGKVSIRGRILTGVITKMKMNRTVVIRRDYLHYVKKYNRFEKRHRNMSVHLSPCFRYCRLISQKSYVVFRYAYVISTCYNVFFFAETSK